MADRLSEQLQATWHEEIPLSAAIGAEIAAATEEELVVRAPLAPNRNVHGTAFAGSLFCVCVLTCWGKIWLAMQRRKLHGRIVIADSRIDYVKGVTGDIVCRCTTDAGAERAALDRLQSSGRTSFSATCTIAGADGSPAVLFEGTYVIVAKRGKK